MDRYFIFLSACRQGFFGENCAEPCIDTCDGCNTVNGLCEYGCVSGWMGYFCNEQNGNVLFYTLKLCQVV